MAFVGFVRKIVSPRIGGIKSSMAQQSVLAYQFSQEFELCGIVLDHAPRYLKACDFYGEFELFKSKSLEFDPQGTFLFRVRPFQAGNSVRLFCKSLRRIDHYEEIAFYLECKALADSFCL